MLHILPRPFGRQMPLCLYLSLFSAFLEHFDKREKRKSVLFSRMQLSSFVSRGHVSLALLLYIVDDVSRTLSRTLLRQKGKGSFPFLPPLPPKKNNAREDLFVGGGGGEEGRESTLSNRTWQRLYLISLETSTAGDCIHRHHGLRVQTPWHWQGCIQNGNGRTVNGFLLFFLPLVYFWFLFLFFSSEWQITQYYPTQWQRNVKGSRGRDPWRQCVLFL